MVALDFLSKGRGTPECSGWNRNCPTDFWYSEGYIENEQVLLELVKELPVSDLVLQTLVSIDRNFWRTQPEPPLQNTLSCRRSWSTNSLRSHSSIDSTTLLTVLKRRETFSPSSGFERTTWMHKPTRDIPWLVISLSIKRAISDRLLIIKAKRSTPSCCTSNRKILKWEFRADTTFETCGTEAHSISLTDVEVERVECSAAPWLQSVDSCPKIFGHALHRIVFLNSWTFRRWRSKFLDVVKIELQCPQVKAHKDGSRLWTSRICLSSVRFVSKAIPQSGQGKSCSSLSIPKKSVDQNDAGWNQN